MITNPEKYPHLMVRLRPYEPRLGQTNKQYRFRVDPKKPEYLVFTKPGEWAKVDTDVAIQMYKCRQQPNNPMSPPIFDICTPEEAKAIDDAAKLEREKKRAIQEPSIETARDLTTGRGDLKLEDISSRDEALSKFNSERDTRVQVSSKTDEKESAAVPDMSWLRRDLLMHARKLGIKPGSRANKTEILALIQKKQPNEASGS